MRIRSNGLGFSCTRSGLWKKKSMMKIQLKEKMTKKQDQKKQKKIMMMMVKMDRERILSCKLLWAMVIRVPTGALPFGTDDGAHPDGYRYQDPKSPNGRTRNSRGMGEVSNVTPIDLLGLQAPEPSRLQPSPGSTDFLLLLGVVVLLLLGVVLLLVQVLLLRLRTLLASSHGSEAFLQYI